MRQFLIQDDVKLVESRLKTFEEKTGCELLLVVSNASDTYPGASWRFGLIAGFLVTFLFSYYFIFELQMLWPLAFLISTLFFVWMGHFTWAKRMALSDWEIERECREKAIELFHTLGTSKVSHKVTAMIMVSVLERHIEVLVDEKLKSQITQTELDELVEIMGKHFKDGMMAKGLVHSIESLEAKILKDFGGKVSQISPSELKDTIHFFSLQ